MSGYRRWGGHNHSRRRFLAGAAGLAGLAGAAALAGCGTGTGTGPSGPTRTVQGFQGPVQVPVDPKRVVCVDHYTPAALLDVGFEPVAVADFNTTQLYLPYLPIYQRLPKVGPTARADPELVAAQSPDLILGTYLPHAPDPSFSRYAELAPTVLFASSADAGDWRQRAVAAADAVGRGPAGEALRQRYQERAKGIRDTHGDALARSRWSMVQGSRNPASWFLTLAGSWGGVVLADAGVQFAGASRDKPGTSTELSFEQVDVLADSDVILVQADNTGVPSQGVGRLLADPIFTRLPAVVAGRAVPTPYFNTLHYGQAMVLLDVVERTLQRL